jgi:hypothetical protein
MISRRISFYKILLCLLGLSFIISSGTSAEKSKVVNIRIDTRAVIGVNEQDIRLNFERIEEMQLPITRIFVPWETWNPSIDYKTFSWDSDEMQSLYRILDLYQRMQTKVILVTVDWFKQSPWEDSELSAKAVLNLLRDRRDL